jgi:hypothetical protein
LINKNLGCSVFPGAQNERRIKTAYQKVDGEDASPAEYGCGDDPVFKELRRCSPAFAPGQEA